MATRYHRLKIWPDYYEAICDWSKSCELRKADRDYRAGDQLLLQEYDPAKERETGYTGREIVRHISRVDGPYVVVGGPGAGAGGHEMVLLSLSVPSPYVGMIKGRLVDSGQPLEEVVP